MTKNVKKKEKPQSASQKGFKVVQGKRRALHQGEDITTSGGCRTMQHQPVH